MSLPDVSFAEERADVIESEIIAAYEAMTGTTLYPADPVRLFLSVLAYRLAVQNAVINLAGKQGLLAYAAGGHLDHLGALLGVERLARKPARTMLRYSLSEALDFPVTIPSGSRVTTRDGSAVFATQTTAVIAQGELSVDVLAEALESGSAANGLVAGQLCEMVDIVAYVASVSNSSTSTDGADVETDERYRERIRLAPESFTCAGSAGAYRYHALKAHQDIAEAAVWTPRPGTVEVILVATGGELPSDEMLAAVRDKLSADDVRPLTDTVTVRGPELVSYEVDVEWDLSRRDAALSASIQVAVADAVEEYRVWQRSAAGRDINPTRLISLMQQAGARRVRVVQPEFTPLTGRQLARETGVSIRFVGIEDE